MNRHLDPQFATSLRTALVQHVNDTPARRPHRKLWMAGCAAMAIGLGGGGAAIAADLFDPPGADRVSTVGAAGEVTATGSATLELGPRPAGANSIELALTCLGAGTISFPDGASLTCTEDDLRNGGTTTAWTMPIEPDQSSLTVSAADTDRWSLNAIYSHRKSTDWGLNSRGQTYGIERPDGSTQTSSPSTPPTAPAATSLPPP